MQKNVKFVAAASLRNWIRKEHLCKEKNLKVEFASWWIGQLFLYK